MSTTNFPGLAGLAAELTAVRLAGAEPLTTHWDQVHRCVAAWVAAQPDLLGALREQLRGLPAAAAAEIAAGSRETTTHFAWRLVHGDGAQFSFWLHEYKPQRDWWAGYANTVHNHRYHFCTTVLAGCFQHEWYDVRLDPTQEIVREVSRSATEVWRPGPVRCVTAEQFHRVARATDGTVTFLVKSDPVRGWSTSTDPATKVSRRHVPVEYRIHDLASRI